MPAAGISNGPFGGLAGEARRQFAEQVQSIAYAAVATGVSAVLEAVAPILPSPPS